MAAAKDRLDFIVIGAQKAATTTLFQLLKHHPEVSLPTGKEAPFFSNDGVYSYGWPAYMESLVREGGMDDRSRQWGTVTPQYMVGGVVHARADAAAKGGYDEWTVPTRIHERLPEVRLIAILRDPVRRAVSHHRMMVRRGAERRSFDEAIGQLLSPDSLDQARARPQDPTGYVTRGEYGRILRGYFDVFDSRQLLVVFTDELERSPATLLKRLHEFIEVSTEFEAPNLGERYLVARPQRGFAWSRPGSWMSPSSPFGPHGLQRALRRNAAARALWHAIPGEDQRRLRRPYERIAFRVSARNRRASASESGLGANAEPDPATVSRLREHYANDAERLTALLGVSPYWLSTADGD